MTVAHEPWLVVLSLFVAFQGSYVGLQLARGVASVTGLRRRQRITGAAVSLALAVWSMHFVGMLALRLPALVDFLVLPTLASFLVCALVVGFAVFFVALRPPTVGRLAAAAAFMGTGIVTMHYLGMQALHASLHMEHDPAWVVASAAIGVAASAAALWLGFRVARNRPVFLSAAIMALAISAMHYTAMWGTTLHGMAGAEPSGQPALSPGVLAVVVAVVAFLVSGLFLLTFVPDADAPMAGGQPVSQPAADDGPVAAGPDLSQAAAAPDIGPPSAAAGGLPVERDGYRRLLDLERIQAIHADGHYTQLFDGETQWFCPLPIGEVEARLDPTLFARIHRSHIVRLDRIASIRKSGDTDQVALHGAVPYRVPVARSRRSWLRERLARTHVA